MQITAMSGIHILCKKVYRKCFLSLLKCQHNSHQSHYEFFELVLRYHNILQSKSEYKDLFIEKRGPYIVHRNTNLKKFIMC